MINLYLDMLFEAYYWIVSKKTGAKLSFSSRHR